MTPTAGSGIRSQINLSTPMQFIKGVGPNLSKRLADKGIETVEDALFFLPRAYEDRRHLTDISELKPGVNTTVLGRILQVIPKRKGRQSQLEVILRSVHTEAQVVRQVSLHWFHAHAKLCEQFQVGQFCLAYGAVQLFGSRIQIVHPETQIVDQLKDGKPLASAHFGRFVPVYSEVDGLATKLLRRIISQAVLNALPMTQEYLPDSLLRRRRLLPLHQSFQQLHALGESSLTRESLEQARRRLVFEEFLTFQIALKKIRSKKTSSRAPVIDCGFDKEGNPNNDFLAPFLNQLPFKLTRDQNQTLTTIIRDLARPYPMSRLVQGDVGSGKTVVAFGAAYAAIRAGYQAALMAPTEILAEQHFINAKKIFSPLGIEVALRTHGFQNSLPYKPSLIIGTHALFQAGAQFSCLGLAIIDEQHRFGVEQKAQLTGKAGHLEPHVMHMTATPIPRSLALTTYGDLDLSIIREKPPGRKPVTTRLMLEPQRPMLYSQIRQTCAEGFQVYVIYPLVEQSEKLELKSAAQMYERFRSEWFRDLKVGLLHGRLKPDEKQQVLDAFKDKKIQILISTTVIEVGIDVPNATLMVIEHPERLGLSQLHQLRGRVGRGGNASQCVLMTSGGFSERLRVIEHSEDGFEIAEADLKIRGPGEFLGKRQSGQSGFRVADIVRDYELLEAANEEAEHLMTIDPSVDLLEQSWLSETTRSRWAQKIKWLEQA